MANGPRLIAVIIVDELDAGFPLAGECIWAKYTTASPIHHYSRRAARWVGPTRAPDEPRPYYALATLSVGIGLGEATIVEWLG